ncbi:hypothetical protein GI374_01505 [Paracoccus sp. S-4012]|uniref:YciI family protein n=1 Tax=Paracoccus sp. S-4012 TaxID=2665648 RepID=UPI0012AFCFF4|nr:YciI family protein [Paracoccus sp. S-4012]MRX49134.1 hypothetical protein [Paracoccus sp. S-4012]
MSAILLRLHPPRPTFPADATAEELSAMERHAAWWQGLADSGEAVAAGPVLDPEGVWGLAILIAGSEAAALRRVEDDPVIVAGLGFRYTAVAMGGLIVRSR